MLNHVIRRIYLIRIFNQDNLSVQCTMGSCILNWTRSQFWGERKPECKEKTIEVRLRSTETQFQTHNIVVEVEGVIDVHYASLTSKGIQHRVFYLDCHPSRYQPRPTELNFGEQTGTGVFPLVMAIPLQTFIQFNRIHHEENRMSPSLSLVVLSVREDLLLVNLLSRSASRVHYVKKTKHRFSMFI